MFARSKLGAYIYNQNLKFNQNRFTCILTIINKNHKTMFPYQGKPVTRVDGIKTCTEDVYVDVYSQSNYLYNHTSLPSPTTFNYPNLYQCISLSRKIIQCVSMMPEMTPTRSLPATAVLLHYLMDLFRSGKLIVICNWVSTHLASQRSGKYCRTIIMKLPSKSNGTFLTDVFVYGRSNKILLEIIFYHMLVKWSIKTGHTQSISSTVLQSWLYFQVILNKKQNSC